MNPTIIEVESRIEAVVGEERCLLSRGICEIVKGELGHRQVVNPIILLIGTIRTEIGLKSLICTLCKTVSVGMIGGRRPGSDLQLFAEFCPKSRNEKGSSVGNNGFREPVVLKYPVKEKPSEIRRLEGFDRRYEVRGSCKPIAYDPNRVATMREGQLHNKIHRNRAPRSFRDLQRV